MDMPDQPDWMDLNDWVLLHRPEVHRATRYLTDMTVQTSVWRQVWQAATVAKVIPSP